VASFHKDEMAVGKIGLIRFTVDAQSRTRSNISMKQKAISINAVGRYLDCEVWKHEEVYVACAREYAEQQTVRTQLNVRTVTRMEGNQGGIEVPRETRQ
jgi:hypothetical protein